jgi:hypothetical protein
VDPGAAGGGGRKKSLMTNFQITNQTV